MKQERCLASIATCIVTFLTTQLLYFYPKAMPVLLGGVIGFVVGCVVLYWVEE